MANTTVVCARIDTKLKQNAEEVLSKLGITPTSAIQMFYSQIVCTNSLPLTLSLPNKYRKVYGITNEEELDEQLAEGLRSLKYDKKYTEEEIDAELAKEFGI